MTALLIGTVLVWSTAIAVSLAFRGPLLLRLHGACLVPIDQAPLAYAVLGDLSVATGIKCPRLFVISAEQPNGFALRERPIPIVVLTDGVFDKMGSDELRGLLALLVARLVDHRSSKDAVVAALALVCCPFHPAHWRVLAGRPPLRNEAPYRTGALVAALCLPALALVRVGFRGQRWFETDCAAASLVGMDRVIRAIEKLEDAVGRSSVLLAPATSSLFCRAPATPAGSIERVFASQPSSIDRVIRVRQRSQRRGLTGSTTVTPR